MLEELHKRYGFRSMFHALEILQRKCERGEITETECKELQERYINKCIVGD